MVVAFIIGFFEELLSHHILLVSFIPLVVYIVGAVSAQLQMLYVRDSAIYPTIPLFRYITRQGAVVVLISMVLGAVLYGYGLLFQDSQSETLVIAIGTAVAALSAIVTGVLVPYALSFVVKDPANATAPIATILSDTTTIIVFFGVATLILV
jgi:magnesium transporter